MSTSTEDNLRIAHEAEKDLNSYQAKQGLGPKSDSAQESGVNELVEKRFPEAGGVKYGPGATASGSDHRKIPEDEGGTRDDRGRLPQAKDFQGKGGPEDSVKIESERRPGDQEVPNLQDLKRRGVAE
ncbi:hypothetical protein N7509_003242 [Penicillium cosmopolitanum]|uniref:Uncharacterized protein n=1 Tax=Penicillium cosmopolitanum TaxID=1131564 RepID=A0A9W9W4X9_9EURO|nr:uncharacterized protein N7509_003242 [Penicillium cosmopolitanum]KAJ5403371.1 hypothetical protein N7509_003242 [Penicillium cosmopolitanum]